MSTLEDFPPSSILNGRNPSIIVFDCDWTLYPYDCDKDRKPPFQLRAYGLTDFWGRLSNPYPDVPSILGAIVDAKIPVAFLSRNPSAEAVENLLHAIPLYSKRGEAKCLWDAIPSRAYFHAYSSNGFGKGKDRHFAALRGTTGVHPHHILFFDDMKDNIQAAALKGTTGVLLGKAGLTWAAFRAGIIGWREQLEKIEAAEAAPRHHSLENGAAKCGPQEEERQGKGEAAAEPLLPEACAPGGEASP